MFKVVEFKSKFLSLLFLAIFSFGFFSIVPYASASGAQNCVRTNMGDAVCQSSGNTVDPNRPTNTTNSSNPSSSLGGGSLLLSGLSGGLQGIMSQLGNLLQGVGQVLVNFLMGQANSMLSGDTSQAGDLGNLFSQIAKVCASFLGMNINGNNVGQDIQSFLVNNMTQQLASGGNILNTNVIDVAQSALSTASSTGTSNAYITNNLSGCDQRLMEVVQSAESNHPDPYNIVIGFAQPKQPDGRPLSQWTIQEVINWGDQRKINGQNTAAGRYQFINSTLEHIVDRAVADGEISRNDLFDEKMQDYLAIELANYQAGLDRFKRGEQGLERTIDKLATIWAGLEKDPGRGHYDGDGLNRAKAGTYERVKAALQSC